ncbi:MAG: ParB/RepB/Spo0J family partition protein [Campylobacterales bacterium]|nr:ParB/RepB/Spo0J family partition protein [Campylobacterales bacterium]
MKSVLGRGLGELLGEVATAYGNENDISNDQVLDIDVNLIVPNPNQPRTIFDEEKIDELSRSIVEHGQLQPINVTRDGDKYILIAGERRLRATKKANLPTIKATILNIENNKLSELALIENIQRDDLNVVDLAKSYSTLLTEYNLTHDELAKKVCKSRSSITNTLRLLNLSEYVQNKLASSNITLGHAKVMIGLTDAKQKQIVDSIIGQKLSVRETEQLIKNIKDKSSESKKSQNMKNDLKLFDNAIKELKSKNLKTTIKNDYIKIHISSNDDIETLSKYFI